MISEAEALEKARKLHPELARWKDSDYARAEQKQGVNWRLHLQMDAIVLRRASDDSLPDHEVIEALQKQGKSELDAIHEIARLIAEDLWARLKMSGSTNDPKVQAQMQEMNEKLNRNITQLARP